MARASEMFFEAAGLTQWGREPDYAPPKVSVRQVERLGGALERANVALSATWIGDRGRYSFTPDTMPAERYYALCDRRYIAAMRYASAVSARGHAAIVKAENAKRIPNSRDAIALRKAMFAAQSRLEEITEAGEEFSTERERIDAEAAADLAKRLYEIAEIKFQRNEQQARADNAAGIVRRRGTPHIIRL